MSSFFNFLLNLEVEDPPKPPRRKTTRREFPLSKKQKEFLYKKFQRQGSCKNVKILKFIEII